MSHPRDPRRRRRHLATAEQVQPSVLHVPPLPAEVGGYVAGGQAPDVIDRGPAAPDYLAGAVRAELLADDWRAEFRAEADRWDTAAELATEQGDEWTDLGLSPDGAPDLGDSEDPSGWPREDPAPTSVVELPGPAGEWAQLERASDRDFTDKAPPADMLGRVGDWVSRHDPRSLEYSVRSKLNARAPLQDRSWPRGPVFDQGMSPPLSLKDASGCTGYAFTAAVNICRPDLHLQAGDAFDLYLGAQRRDHIPGEAYPGTSVLAAAQEAQSRGWIDAYLWAFGIGDVAQALLQVGPVVLGLPWLSQMQVDADGILTPGGDRSGLGHAICAVGIKREHAGRPGPWFELQQSYGPAVGVGGLLYLHADHLRLLLRGVGEACVPIIGKD